MLVYAILSCNLHAGYIFNSLGKDLPPGIRNREISQQTLLLLLC